MQWYRCESDIQLNEESLENRQQFLTIYNFKVNRKKYLDEKD